MACMLPSGGSGRLENIRDLEANVSPGGVWTPSLEDGESFPLLSVLELL